MAVTVEELEVVIRANFEQALPQLKQFAKLVNDTLGKTMDAVRAQNERMAKALVPAVEKARPAIEKTAKALQKQKAAIQEAARAEKERWEIAKRAAERYKQQLKLSDDTRAPQVITAPRTRLASQIVRDNEPEAINDSYVRVYQKIQSAVKAASDGVQQATSIANARVQELRGTLENLQAQMENQLQKYKTLLAKSLEIEKTKGSGSMQALSNERQILAAEAAYDRLQKRADKIREALAKAQEPVRQLARGMRAAQAPAEQTEKSVQKVAQNTRKATVETKDYERQAKRSGKSTRSVFERLGYSIKSMLTVGLLYKAVAAIRRAFTEAMENIARGSERANATLSKLSASFLYVKNSVVAAFLPALEALTPVITRVCDALAKVFNLVGMVTARLFDGSTTVVQAVKVQNDYAASLGGTGAAAKQAAKDAQRAALSFDELNKLSEPQEDASSGGAAQPGEMFEEVKIPAKTLAWVDRMKKQLDEWITKFQSFWKKIKTNPVIQAAVKVVKKAVSNILEALGSLLDWALKNPDKIVTALSSIFAAVSAYKVVSTISRITKGISAAGGLTGALKALTPLLSHPVALAVAGVAAALTAVGVAVWVTKERMREADLAKRFGDITLSMEEIEEIAHQIVSTKSLEKMSEALTEIAKIDGLAANVEDALATLNKLNWKVSIGLELTEEEKEQYRSAVSQYVSGTQEWVNQNHYAIKLAIDALVKDPEDRAEMQSGFDSFYFGVEGELARLGKELNDRFNTAFSDGILTIDEEKEMESLMGQIAELKEKLSKLQFDAKLETVIFKEGGVALTPESYGNLAEELGEEVQSAVAGFDESLEFAISQYKVRLDSDAEYDLSQYNDDIEKLKSGYLENIGEVTLRATEFQLDTLYKGFEDDLKTATPKFQEIVRSKSTEWMTPLQEKGQWGDFFQTIAGEIDSGFDSLTPEAKKNLSNLLQKLEPEENELLRIRATYKELGCEVPESISQGLTDIAVLKAMAGDTEALYTLVGATISTSPEYMKMLEEAKKSGVKIPENVSMGMELGQGRVEKSGEKLAGSAIDSTTEALNKGKKTVVDAAKSIWQAIQDVFDEPISLADRAKNSAVYQRNVSPSKQSYSMEVPKLARGAVLRKPTVAQVAEYAGARSNPEIVAPQSILKETFVEAMFPTVASISEKLDAVIQAVRENGVEISPDIAGALKIVQKGAADYRHRTGQPAF